MRKPMARALQDAARRVVRADIEARARRYERDALIRAAWEDGATISEIGDLAGLSRTTASIVLGSPGKPGRPPRSTA